MSNPETEGVKVMTSAEYVGRSGKPCPFCKAGISTTYAGLHMHRDNSVSQECNCLECGATWTDLYELTGFSPRTGPNPRGF